MIANTTITEWNFDETLLLLKLFNVEVLRKNDPLVKYDTSLLT